MREIQLRSTEQAVLKFVESRPGVDGATVAQGLGYSVGYIAQLLASLSKRKHHGQWLDLSETKK